ncbi:MAG TPA: DUF4012 domain-containing protein, partial [Acidimicrobiia bacterium]|nr:DUF4012 domain-containing protein [Acidimicrobiia bacterium]
MRRLQRAWAVMSMRRLRRSLRAPSWVLPLVGIVVGLLGLLAVFGLASARQELALARSALESARTSVASRDVAAATTSLDQADSALGRAAAPAGRLPLNLLSPIPLVGSPVKALSDGVRAGHEAVAAGRLLNQAAGSFTTDGATGGDGHNITAIHAASASSGVALEAAAVHLASARKILAGPAGAWLPPVSHAAKSLMGTVDSASKQLAGAERGLTLLSSLSDPAADRRLLLLSQDTMELRPTGGFIGSFGVFRFDHGKVSMERYDSYETLPAPSPAVDAPAGLADSLDRPWDVSNSNWWPDFPTSAKAAMDLFARQGGGPVDGVIAVTQDVMADLVGAVGPVKLADYAKPVTQDGFAERVLYEVELKRPQDNPRKKFLTDLADEVFHRLFALPADKLPAVAQALGKAASAGDLQIYFTDPTLQAGIDGTVLDGALPAPKGDFLELVDSNMTASKSNAQLVRTVTYTVRPGAKGGGPAAALDIDYANNGPASDINPYYNGLLRIYVPKGTTLSDDSTGDVTPADDGPYDVITTQVYVEPMGKLHVHLDYTLPATVAAGGDYHLTWLR